MRVIELPLENGLTVRAGIDPENGRILFSKGTIKSASASFETRYGDFRMVEGRLFAFKETSLAGETKTADIVLSKIELLPTAPADAFKP